MADKYTLRGGPLFGWQVCDESTFVHAVADTKEHAEGVARLMNRAYENGRQDAHAHLRKVLDL